MAAAYNLISSQVLGSTASTVTFSSIPSTYSDLKLVVSARGDAAGQQTQIVIKINGDTATNYSLTNLAAGYASVSSSSYSNQTPPNILNFNASGSTASTFGSAEIYIPNYNSTGNKPFLILDTGENNSIGSNDIDAIANLYRGTSGISSITLSPVTGNFVANSSFYLYGIKNS
jgi:hypothetical protein